MILSDRTGLLVIIAANQRYEAAKAIGLTDVPTILLPDLTEQREREIVIRDNVSLGDFDWDAIANEWSDVDLKDWGVDLPVWDNIEEKDISLPDNEKGFSQMTFTLSDLQKQDVDTAVRLCKQANDFEGTGNENSNGNALAFIVADYLSNHNG